MTLLENISKNLFNGGLSYNGLIPSFVTPLASTLVPERGSATPSFSRDTTATVTDFEGVVIDTLIDELRFPGLRRVENLLSSTGAYTTETVVVESGEDYILSCTGTGTITLSGASTEVVSNSEITFTAASTSLTLTVSGTVLTPQLEVVSGTQTEASEYVSSGELSWPYHGAGVDCVKYLTIAREGDGLVSSGALLEGNESFYYDVTDVITQGIGSLCCECTLSDQSTEYNILVLSDKTANNLLSLYVNVDGYLSFKSVVGGTEVIDCVSTVTDTDYEKYKLWLLYEDDNVKLYCNGTFLCSITSGAISRSLDTLNIGSDYDSAATMDGTIKDIRYYKTVIAENKVTYTEVALLIDGYYKLLIDSTDNYLSL